MYLRKLLYDYNINIGVKKMELIKAKIEGFRNIENATLFFDSITSLVSINSYGKSNLLNAIDFAIEFIKSDKESKSDQMKWVLGLPINKNIQSKNFIADFEFKTKLENEEYFINYGYEFEWIKQNKKGAKIVKEWLNLKLNEKGQRYVALIDRHDGKTLFRSSITARCSVNLNIEKNELAINKLMLNEELYYYDILKNLNSLNVYIERHLDTTMSYMPSPFVKGEEDFDLDIIENIPRVVYFLKEKFPDKYLILVDAYKKLFPNIVDIEVDGINIGSKSKNKLEKSIPYLISDKIYVMNVKDINLNQPIRFQMLSDGAKRVFLMLTYAILADLNGLLLIAFEEPENSIHPNLLQSYLNAIIQLAGKCKIIIASHSPYILQYVSTNNIYIGIPNKNGIANFKKIDHKKIKQLLKDASDANESVGDYIFELLSGSEDQLDLLEEYLEN